MIEVTDAAGLAWYWWLLIAYGVGAAVCVFVAGLLDCDEPEVIVPITIFWPVLLAVGCAALPFLLLWLLGNRLQKRWGAS